MTGVGLDTLKPSAWLSQGAATFLHKWQPCRKFCLSFDISSSLSFFSQAKKTSLHQPVWAPSEDQFDQNSTEVPSEPERALEGLEREPANPLHLRAQSQGSREALSLQSFAGPVGVSHSLGLGCRLFFLRPEDSAVCLQACSSRSSRTY